MDQNLRPAFEKHFNLCMVFHGGGDAEAETCVLHHITRSVSLAGRVSSGNRLIFPLKKGLVSAWHWLLSLVSVLRVALAAMHACGFPADHHFNSMGQDASALAAPAVNRPTYVIGIWSFRNFHVLKG